MTEYLAVLEQWKARKAKDTASAGPEPAKPPLPRVACSDVTVERLGELLQENPRGLLLVMDELAGWFGSFNRYKKGTSSDLPHWLKFHRAGWDIIDRKSTEKKSLFIDRAAVSVCGTIQPGILAKLVKGDFLDSGLVARLLLAMPPKRRKVWRDVDLDASTADAYKQLLDGLFRLDFETNGKGERVPIALRLDADAQRTWETFFNEWSGEQTDAEGERAAALAKLEGYAARFALLHHVVERISCGQDDRLPITAESVEAGSKLCRWFAREAERVYSVFGESAEQRETRRLVEFIQARGGNLTARQLHRSNSRKYPTADAAALALDALAGAGHGIWTTSTPAGGGRPSRSFRLHAAGASAIPSAGPDTTPAVRACPPVDPAPKDGNVSTPEPASAAAPSWDGGQSAFFTADENGELNPDSSPWR